MRFTCTEAELLLFVTVLNEAIMCTVVQYTDNQQFAIDASLHSKTALIAA